ncbi:deoxynucleotidyltransferase terminal-interacting protein 2 isoform X1 [Selaginella moellendorffii]|uniref:deoxynucleotidyltransferase terminal-interacting protein 2 isoform X1 n=1 Tax=Selaginella moellendorffii TaxID=88036 RepID=UPI000D1C2286|nr:deoxynucleotidyltransferase terminal-interacting protein 2 isoform X1 [Selaginella moellendorffii]|eukprot:XP_002975646.2 deoxynucleotidyltransferase terminal-interacting protein 2 isoform X1 [Selaginella moellendorffii]
MASADDENAGDVPPAIMMLRTGLKNLTRKVDGLLKKPRALEAERRDSSSVLQEKEIVAEPVIANARSDDSKKEEKEIPSVGDGSVANGSSDVVVVSSDSESSDDDEENDEDMVDLLVNSLRVHSGSTRSVGDRQALEKQCFSIKKATPKAVSWVPNTGLPTSTQLLTTKLQSSIMDPEKDLQDGLFVPTRNVRKLNKLARKNIPDTAGAKWFNMPAQTLTPELKRELQLIKLRGALDPKRHYKKEDSKKLPKYFQIGTVVEGPGEFYSSRLTRAERKATIAEELLADAGVQTFRKRKFAEIMEKSSAGRNNKRKQKKSFKKRR